MYKRQVWKNVCRPCNRHAFYIDPLYVRTEEADTGNDSRRTERLRRRYYEREWKKTVAGYFDRCRIRCMYCLGDRRSEKNRTIGAFDDACRTGGIVGTFVALQQTV